MRFSVSTLFHYPAFSPGRRSVTPTLSSGCAMPGFPLSCRLCHERHQSNQPADHHIQYLNSGFPDSHDQFSVDWPDEFECRDLLELVSVHVGIMLSNVDRALALSNLPSDQLELEITESLLFQDSDAPLTCLETLHGQGLLRN